MSVNYDDFPLTGNENVTFKIRILHKTNKIFLETKMWA